MRVWIPFILFLKIIFTRIIKLCSKLFGKLVRNFDKSSKLLLVSQFFIAESGAEFLLALRALDLIADREKRLQSLVPELRLGQDARKKVRGNFRETYLFISRLRESVSVLGFSIIPARVQHISVVLFRMLKTSFLMKEESDFISFMLVCRFLSCFMMFVM